MISFVFLVKHAKTNKCTHENAPIQGAFLLIYFVAVRVLVSRIIAPIEVYTQCAHQATPQDDVFWAAKPTPEHCLVE